MSRHVACQDWGRCRWHRWVHGLIVPQGDKYRFPRGGGVFVWAGPAASARQGAHRVLLMWVLHRPPFEKPCFRFWLRAWNSLESFFPVGGRQALPCSGPPPFLELLGTLRWHGASSLGAGLRAITLFPWRTQALIPELNLGAKCDTPPADNDHRRGPSATDPVPGRGPAGGGVLPVCHSVPRSVLPSFTLRLDLFGRGLLSLSLPGRSDEVCSPGPVLLAHWDAAARRWSRPPGPRASLHGPCPSTRDVVGCKAF